jgi:cell division protein ZapA
MSQTNTVTVHILDKEYCIACPAEERANLESAARYLDGKMREIRSGGKVIGADRIAVMAALNITHDLLHKQQRQEQQSTEARAQVRDLLDRVDHALGDGDADLFGGPGR